jgi:DNA adenine methylase
MASFVSRSSPSAIARPFLKWVGGKGQLLKQYRAYFPQQFDTYYEPFLGGGAVFFFLSGHPSIPLHRAHLTDINPELVNVYQCVQQQVDAVIARLSDHRRCHSPDYYYQVRRTEATSPIERAARLIYLNKTCFNGLYRENSKGQFNVPMGRYKNPSIFDPAVLHAASQALQRATIARHSFDHVLELAQSPRDFVYFDPPYYPISATSNFTGYTRRSFGEAEHLRLFETFQILAERGVQVMLSNSDCPFVRDLYSQCDRAQLHTISAARLVNCNAQRRGKITELLITSYRPERLPSPC